MTNPEVFSNPFWWTMIGAIWLMRSMGYGSLADLDDDLVAYTAGWEL